MTFYFLPPGKLEQDVKRKLFNENTFVTPLQLGEKDSNEAERVLNQEALLYLKLQGKLNTHHNALDCFQISLSENE